MNSKFSPKPAMEVRPPSGGRTSAKIFAKFLALAVFAVSFFALPSLSFAATAVYYSVGQTTADLKNGTPTVTIASGTATFSAAQTGNIGVGDRVTYNTSSIAYIAGKISTSQWNVVTATGTVPADVTTQTVNSITREYTSLSAAEAGATDANHLNTTDLVAGNYQLNFPAYYDSGPDTTAVTVGGYTTGATNFIKIYTPNNTTTEANQSQRHSGNWNNNNYRIEVASTSPVVNLSSDYARTEGLQLEAKGSGNYRNSGIQVGSNLYGIYISDNIVKNTSTNNNTSTGIHAQANTGRDRYVWNNIVYGFNNGASYISTGIMFNYGVSYAYNNTVYDNGTGIGGGNTIAKNNIAQNNTNNYIGSFNASSSNNISSDPTAPGANSKANTTVKFLDAKNKDFRLDSKDTVANDAGIDLSADANLAFSIDIIGHTRGTDGFWDIGASEAATEIFRSVGPGNTTALATGTSNALTISGTTAVFANALPSRVGVGDALQYDSNNDGTIDSVAFVHLRNSSKSYTVASASGGLPTSTSASDNDWSLYRAYTSLANAEAGIENTGIIAALRNFDTWSGGKNIFASNEQWNIAAYADATDTTAVTINGWNTGAQDYIKVYTPVNSNEVGVSQRHSGVWDDAKFNISNSFGLNADNVKIEGIQINQTGSGSGILINSSSLLGEKIINDNILRASNQTLSGLYGIPVSGKGVVKIYNNIFYGWRDSGVYIYGSSNVNSYLYSNTFFDSGGYASIYCGVSCVLKNNIVQDSSNGYSGTFSADSNYNISDLASDAPGADSKNLTNVQFVDEINSNFHLSATDTAARNAGVNLQNDSYLWFEHDIDGQARDGSWDIGADEVVPVSAQASQSVNTSATVGLDYGLVGYWSFDGPDIDWSASSGQIKDKSGNGNHGTAVNLTKSSSVAGKLGQGLDFDGSNDQINISAKSSLDLPVFSWSGWVNMHTANGFGTIYTRQGDFNRRLLMQGSAGSVKFFSQFGNSDTGTAYDYKINTWYYVTHIVDSINDSEQIYINGQLVVQALNNNTLNFELDTGNLFLGNWSGTTYSLDGQIDEVRIYDRALSAEEIDLLYRKGQVEISSFRASKGITDGLVGHWTFDGKDTDWGSATAEFKDVSGNGNHGNAFNMSAASVVSGKVGQGIMIEGVGDYINVGNTGFSNSVTVSVWAKRTAQGDSVIVTKTNQSREWELSYSGGGYAYFNVNGNNTGGSYLPIDNQWHNFTGTYDGSGGIKLFIDGILKRTNSYTGGMTNFNNSVGIGKRTGGTEHFKGSIDEVRIYNRALSATEINNLYKAGQVEIRR